MDVALVGAEFEENLSLRYLAAAVVRKGFGTGVIPYNDSAQLPRVIEAVLTAQPDVVGISVPFQARASELLAVATVLRAHGFTGHICAGGHFATFEYRNILRDVPAIDSVIRHEGEDTLRALCTRVRSGASLDGVEGLVTRSPDGVRVAPKRPLPPLDELPFPVRPDRPHEVLGVPCAPIVGSRGCYADCSFCCIYAYAENAHGARYRRRSPENIAEEMQDEYERRGVRLFVFHDDNFFVPSPAKNLARYERLATLLDTAGLDDIALVIKCRPNDVDLEVFEQLNAMGMIRAYVGIETNSEEGVVSLNRRITPEDNRRALTVLRELDIYCSYNVLIFDPEATLDGVQRNLDFMREFSDVPSNFCRAEVYAGTPLKAILEEQGRLHGDYLAWGYEMREPRVELLFRITSTAFMSRNFKPDGVANLVLGLRFDNEVLRRFYPQCWDARWHEAMIDLSRRVTEHSVTAVERALDFVKGVRITDHRSVKTFTRDLAREVNRSDIGIIGEIRSRRRDMERRIRTALGRDVAKTPDRAPVWSAESLRLGSSVGLDVSTELLPTPSAL